VKHKTPFLISFIFQSSFFGFSAPCEIDVKINKVENRKNGSIKDKQGNLFKAPVFMVSSSF
jgi:vacuolar protein sorting-associated protein 26